MSEANTDVLKTTKNFEEWSKLKRQIQDKKHIPLGYKEREIWWVSLGQNIGAEEDGKNQNFARPVLIIKGFSKFLFWGIPLSTTKKQGAYYYKIEVSARTSNVLLSQLRALDTHRLIKKHGMLNKTDFVHIKRQIISLLT